MDILIQTGILILGLLLILWGANLLVDGASEIAKRFGISEFVIGLTIVGIGTSSPEMVVSFLSAIQGNADMAVGNIVGSNIFNVFFVLATSATIRPLSDYPGLLLDAGMAFLGCFLVMIFVWKGKHRIGRWQGAFMLAVYAIYLFWLIKTM